MIDKFNEKCSRENKAVIEIQRHWRGYKSRKNVAKTKANKPELSKQPSGSGNQKYFDNQDQGEKADSYNG
jgi:hypothetical protein